jgi:hypothetical protein
LSAGFDTIDVNIEKEGTNNVSMVFYRDWQAGTYGGEADYG